MNRNVRKALTGSLQRELESYRAREGYLFNVAQVLFESLDTPVALSCSLLLKYGELEGLVRKTVDPSSYADASSFRDDYQAVSFLRKAPLEIEGVDPEENARKKFFESEARCKETNSRIRSLVAAPERVSGPIFRAIMHGIGKIHQCLGAGFDPSEWLDACRFGPGAFTHPSAKGLTSLYDKLQVRPSCTKDMADVAALLVTSRPQWARSVTDCEEEGFWPIINASDLDFVPGNRVAFVPKTAVTHRAIAIEPLLNVYSQLGIGKMMRRRLMRFGINLDDQTRNQRAAREGSLTGLLATIDLSSASDSVARELVRLVLPERWFFAADLVRSKSGWIEGKWFPYEKFSSMGNGCTFELETLIFWGLMHGVCSELQIETNVLVYGDDIVIPVAAYGFAKEVLEFCGFSFNMSKSFGSGAFRESCGKDYYDGVDVRPFLQEEIPNEIEKIFALANGIREVASRRNHLFGCDIRLRDVWDTIVHALPRSIRTHICVPRHAGATDGVRTNWDEAQRSSLVVPNKDGWHGYNGPRYKTVAEEPRRASNLLGVVASQLHRLGDGGTQEFLKLTPQGVRATKLSDADPGPPNQGRRVTYQLQVGAFYGPWTDYGPWL